MPAVDCVASASLACRPTFLALQDCSPTLDQSNTTAVHSQVSKHPDLTPSRPACHCPLIREPIAAHTAIQKPEDVARSSPKSLPACQLARSQVLASLKPNMEYRNLGRTGLKASRLLIGTIHMSTPHVLLSWAVPRSSQGLPCVEDLQAATALAMLRLWGLCEAARCWAHRLHGDRPRPAKSTVAAKLSTPAHCAADLNIRRCQHCPTAPG